MNRSSLFLGILLVWVLLTAVYPPSPVQAAACLSTGTGQWSNPGTWQDCGGVPPQSGDTAQILTGHTVTLDIDLPAVTITIDNGGILDTATPRDLGGSAVIVNGTFRLSEGGYVHNGTFTYNPDSTLQFATTSEFDFDGFTHVFWPFGGDPTHVTVGTGGLNLNSAARLVSGTIQISGPLRNAENLTIIGSFQINNGGYVANQSPIYGPASTLIYNSSGTYNRGHEWNNHSPHHVRIANNTTFDLFTTAVQTMTGNLTIDSGSTFLMGSTDADFNVQGNISNSGIFSLSTASGNLTVGGNWTKTASGTFTNNGSWVTFNGGSTQNLSGGMSITNRFERIIVTNNSEVVFHNNVGMETGLQVDSGSTFRPNTAQNFAQEIGGDGGDLTCIGICRFNRLTIRNINASGTTGIIDVNENLEIMNTNSAFVAPPSSAIFTIAGNYSSANTSGMINFNGGTVHFDGGTTQIITLAGATAFHNLIVGSGTVLINNGNIYATTTGTLINNGILRRVQTVTAPGLHNFGLTSVTMVVNSFTGAPQITVDRLDNDHPGATAAIAANSQRYWIIGAAGGTFAVDVIFADETLTTNTQQRTCRTADNGSTWDCVADADPAPTVTRRNGVTAFSDWQNCGACGPTAVSLTTFTSPPNKEAAHWAFYSIVLVLAFITITLRHKNLDN